MSDFLIGVGVWIGAGMLGAGWLVSQLQSIGSNKEAREGRREDVGVTCLLGIILGPICMFVAFFLTGFAKYGFWRLR